MITPERTLYHPLPIGADFIRKNVFELIIGGLAGDPLSIFCNKTNIVLPKTATVDVPWISGIMRVAGRISSGYELNVSFIVGQKGAKNSVSQDALQRLYSWRNDVFDHDTGKINLASNYKKEANLLIYDVTSEQLVYDFKIEGLWPHSIQDMQFAVEDAGVLELQAVFAADKIQMENVSSY